MLSFARVHFHLTPEEFWELTPRQYQSMFRQWRENRLWLERAIGINTAVTMNSGFTRSEKSVYAFDFMPSLTTRERESMRDAAVGSIDDQALRMRAARRKAMGLDTGE